MWHGINFYVISGQQLTVGTGSEEEDLGDTTTDDEMNELISPGEPGQDLEDQVLAEMGPPAPEQPKTGTGNQYLDVCSTNRE